MFENMTEKEAREHILGLVGQYCDTFHNVKKKQVIKMHNREGQLAASLDSWWAA